MKKGIDVSHLETVSVYYDFRRDLFWFMQYCLNNDIKRTVYGNTLLKGEYKKIAKYLGHPELMDDYEKDLGVWWIDYLDSQALEIGWTNYDTEGEYIGYTSSSPAFQDNYIKTRAGKFKDFLHLSAIEQEKYLFRHFRDTCGSRNNLMDRSVFGQLDHFDTWGSATGVLPTLKFGKSKLLLTEVLEGLEPNVWYAVSDLIKFMKQNHTWFLIPEEVYIMENAGWRKPEKRVKYDRYYNFQEERGYSRQLRDEHIANDDPLGFEKVEGRFIERFLEDYFFTLAYVELGYSKEVYKGKGPEMDTLQAFKLSPVFFQLSKNQPLTVNVSVQPNFEIYVDAPVYPIASLQALKPFTDVLKEDRQIILKLNKQYVLNYLVDNPEFDIKQFLTEISNTPISQNILTEIQEWTERTDVFTLYENFGLYEGPRKQPLADSHTVHSISSGIRLVSRPSVLYDKLKEHEAVPLRVQHTENSFQLLPKGAKTVFPIRKISERKKASKKMIEIQRKELVTFTFSNQEFFDAVLLVILKARIWVEINKAGKSLTFLKKEEAQIKTLLNKFKDKYQIRIKKQA